MFGHYRLDELVGRGGMGEVHRAYDTRRHRVVALKRLRPGLADDAEYQERFRREARLVARLSSPHVVPIHDFGEMDGRLFLDMRLVPGTDLAGLVHQSGPLSPSRAVEVVRQIADALDSAHRNGLVHRDVKPSNILLDSTRHRDFAYLVDFGIVRSIGDGRLTMTGALVGTTAYMAPEMFIGRPADRRVDIYALGCLLFEVLTGSPPFVGQGPVQMYHHLHSEPPRPSAHRYGLPPGLDAVVARAMAKDPEQRFASAGQLADAASDVVSKDRSSALARSSGDAQHDRDPRDHRVPPAPARRRRASALVGVAVLVVVLAGALGLTLYLRSPGGAPLLPPPGTTTSTATATAPPGPVATASDGSFEVDVPSGWSSYPPAGTDLLNLRSADQGANILVSAQPADAQSLDAFAAQSAQEIVDILDGTIDAGGIESSTLADAPARRYTYTLPAAADYPEARGRQIIARHDGADYFLTYTGRPDLFNATVADYESVVDSWRWRQ
jgi:serine/threonine-protein kinase